MPLLQNFGTSLSAFLTFDYQSECHCSKTSRHSRSTPWPFDYQSECHCSKTAEAEGNAARAVEALHAAAGFELNPNSPKRVCEFLGTTSSAAAVLQDLIDAGGEGAERARLVQEARGWLSVDSRYYTPYLEQADAADVLHCNLNLIGTYTGRLSCSHPNLQAVAKATEVFKVKDVFTARPFDYQSECHCSKTQRRSCASPSQFDYQSECHCSKTIALHSPWGCSLTTSQNATAPKLHG